MPLSNAPIALKERAKQGDEKAIAAVLNHFFQPQGITAKATLKQGNLLLLIESEMVPDQDTLVPFIHQGLANLGIANIKPNVKIGGRQVGGRTAWQQEIDLNHPPAGIVSGDDRDDNNDDDNDGDNDGDNDLPLADDDDMPIEDDDFLSQRSTEDDEEDYAEEDSSVKQQKSQDKFSKKNLLILAVVLLLLLLGGGVAAYFFLPGFLGGEETTESEPVSTPAAPSATDQPEAASPPSEPNATKQPDPTKTPQETPQETPQTTPQTTPQETPQTTPQETPSANATAQQNASTQGQSPETTATSEANTSGSSTTISVPFYQAVNKANQAWEMTQKASSSEEWEKIADLWDDALLLMKEVPADHSNYKIAEDRIPKYTKYRDFAKQMAEITRP